MKKRVFLLVMGLVLAGGVWWRWGLKNTPPPLALSEEGKKAVVLKRLLQENKISFRGDPVLGKDERSLVITLTEGGEVVFSLDKDLQNQIISLQLILREIKMKSASRVKTIDLRGDKPYVIF